MKRNVFVSNLAKLMSATGIAQAIYILSTPVLTRIYTPADFGLLAVYTSIPFVVGVVSSLRYELAIVIANSDEEAAALKLISFRILAAFSIALFIVIALFRSVLPYPFRLERMGGAVYSLPFFLFFYGGVRIYEYWYTRNSQFGIFSIAKVCSAIAIPIFSLVFIRQGASGLAFGYLAGQIINFFILCLADLRDPKRPRSPRNSVMPAASKFKKFPLYDSWSSLINTMSWQLIPLLLARYFSDASAGQYSMSMRVIQIPMSIIGYAYGQVFYKKASEENANGTLYPYLVKTTKQLFLISAVPNLAILLLGRIAFKLFLGEAWVSAGLFSQLLSPWSFIWFVSSITSTVLLVLQHQRMALLINIVILVLRVASIQFGVALHSDIAAIAALSVTGIASYGVMLAVGIRSAKNTMAKQTEANVIKAKV